MAHMLEREKPRWRALVDSRACATRTDKGKTLAWPLRGVRITGDVHGRGACTPGQMLRAMKSGLPADTPKSGFESQVRKWNISGLTVERSAAVGEKVSAPEPAFKVFEKNGCSATGGRQRRGRWGTYEPRRGCAHVLMCAGRLSTAARTEQTPALTPAGTHGSFQ